MRLFFGGLIGAAVGAVYASLILYFTADSFAFAFGVMAVAPLGAVIGCPLGIMSARRIRWGQRHTRIIGRSAVALAVPAAVACLIYGLWDALHQGYDGFWYQMNEPVMQVMVGTVLMMTMAAAVFGGTVGAAVGAVLSLFKRSRVSPPEVERPQEPPDWEEAWPPTPDRSYENK